MPPTKQAHDCRVGDILLYKNEESRMITAIRIDRKEGVRMLRTTTLAGENPRFDTHDASDEVTVRGTQEALFQ